MADDLYRLLTQSSQQEQPFVLVGAGLGGLVARFYAHLFERFVTMGTNAANVSAHLQQCVGRGVD